MQILSPIRREKFLVQHIPGYPVVDIGVKLSIGIAFFLSLFPFFPGKVETRTDAQFKGSEFEVEVGPDIPLGLITVYVKHIIVV